MLHITNGQLKIKANQKQELGYQIEVLLLQDGDPKTYAKVGTFLAPQIPVQWNEERWITIPYLEAYVKSGQLVLCGEIRDELECLWKVEDQLSLEGNDISFQREITLVEGERSDTTVPFVFYAGYKVDESQYPLTENSYHMIPGMSYNDNPFGEGLYPKNITKNENQFLFRADRLAIPGQVLSTKDFSLGFYRLDEKLDKGEREGEQCSIGFLDHSDHYELAFYYPERELNRSYSRKGEWDAPYRKGLEISSGQTLAGDFYFTVIPRKTRHDYAEILWKMMIRAEGENHPKQALPLLETYRKRVEGANNHFWTPSNQETSGIKGWYGHRVNHLDRTPGLDIIDFRVGFIGRSLMMATESLRLGLELNQEVWVERATQLFDWFCDNAPTKEGWFYPDYNGQEWFTSWKENAISTRKQVEGIIQLLEAYHIVKIERKEDRTHWLNTSKHALDWLITHGKEGAYSRWYSFDGTLVDPLLTHTPYVITALIKMFHVTGEKKYLQNAQFSWKWVIEHIINPEIYFGGTLDASTEDKEAAIITAEAGVMLFEATGDHTYLEGAKKACDQVISYMMMYNVTLSKGTSLGQQDFYSFGTTLVSPENNHIDPYTTSALVKVGVYSKDLKYARAGKYNLQATTQDISSDCLQREIWYQGKWWYFDKMGKGNAQPWSVGWSQILAASVYKEVSGIFVSHKSEAGIGIDGCHLDNQHFSQEQFSFTCKEQLGLSRQIEILVPDIQWEKALLNVNGRIEGLYSKEKWASSGIKIAIEANQSVHINITNDC